jgi:membrane-associated protein
MILFIIIFCETGLVVAPFLPGDTLIFAAGTFAAIGALNIWVLYVILVLAAIFGDTVNYWIGSFIGPRVFHEKSKFFKKEYVNRTQKFFEKYGSMTIILARFVPVIRTFAPFLAGVGKMKYWKFLAYNVLGAILWVALYAFGGYYFGNIQFIKDNFSLAILIIFVLSFIPVFTEYYRHKHKQKKSMKENKQI